MTTAPPNNRASLLAGLRTGGVRSSSTTLPHTAAPGASFNITRFASQHHQPSSFPEEDEDDQLAEMPSQNVYVNRQYSGNRTLPMTAAVDGSNNRFAQQQRGMNPNSAPFTPSFATPNMIAQSNNVQAQAFQLQMMQMELMRLQAVQAQQQARQYQAELLAQAQRQQQQQCQNRRASLGFTAASAGPMSTTFDLRSAALSAQMRRAKEQQPQSSVVADEPMTASLGGRFGSRAPSVPTVPMVRYNNDDNDGAPIPPTPNSTTVISGGTSLGNPTSNNLNSTGALSKSDSATSWRRADRNNSVLRANRVVTSPSVKVTPPPGLPVAAPKARPQPLRFSPAVSQPLPTVTIDTSEGDDIDDADSTSSSKSGGSNSSPTSPHSSSSNEMPLSPREEASKKLYEGLGIGRPRSTVSNTIGGIDVSQAQESVPIPVVFGHRLASQPTRQPRGPPSGADELGPKNFATRIRRKAIGGLGMLMGARERRELVDTF
ncbi:uncharacterized protein BT62DRAFT_928989 [Guyanagaster necrorhizus]|uniref:Uncharacterized protein n=1 Tax=Guyanagaster necrorhizus TaxID=856835 RepID=A0A9P8AV64_9AGAR|nr:uncharacterized protein BT62DRAFT_928989 [Guyanagaster necrorhizus MCA 3950]KAG7448985.1 hypothetical protein BT62DRAFT_928989 [Guyanagaster necrorhizus MCA 3950]